MVWDLKTLLRFRSTGSYEPDLSNPRHKSEGCRFDPQALTSLTFSSFSMTAIQAVFRSTGSYEPDHDVEKWNDINELFRSTGSYEPDPAK